MSKSSDLIFTATHEAKRKQRKTHKGYTRRLWNRIREYGIGGTRRERARSNNGVDAFELARGQHDVVEGPRRGKERRAGGG